VYSDASLFELKVNNETRDIWQIFMKRGEFNTALQYAGVSRPKPFRVKAIVNQL
jgi:Pep3/Vps18/deep orange family